MPVKLVWPVVIGLLVLTVIKSDKLTRRLREILSPFQSVQLFGATLNLDRQTGAEAGRAFGWFREQVKWKCEDVSRKHKVDDKFSIAVEYIISDLKSKKCKVSGNLRFTLHIKDILFENSYYQLVDYRPEGENGRGRAYTNYFGIAGRSWRLGLPLVEGNVPGDPNKLIVEWGMTREQALEKQDRRSFLCVPIKDGDFTLAVFYADSLDEQAFQLEGVDKIEALAALSAAVVAACNKSCLTPALKELVGELRPSAPSIRVHDR